MELNYTKIGRLLVTQKPSQAKELIESYYVSPQETELSKVKDFYERFCIIHPKTKDYKATSEHRRLFIAVILHLYQPEVFLQKQIRVTPGLGKVIREPLGVFKPRISSMIREAIAMEKVYSDFKEKVQHVLLKIQEPTNQL